MRNISVSIISRFLSVGLAAGALSLMSPQTATAARANLNFTQLSGVAGGNPQLTGVFRADLSQVGFNIRSLLIVDGNNPTTGVPGAFSGFDLDAVKISTHRIDAASDINAIAGVNLFNFSDRGTFFFPGTQRPPVDDKLFGTGGSRVNHAIATLDRFDANSTTDSSAFGFVSLGNGGKIGFNFSNPIATGTPLYLYIGEVGDNEFPSAEVLVTDQPVNIPEPATVFAISLMGLYFFRLRHVQNTTVI
ncbi:MAG: PEP-CTERM sorting domain-containing protein [Nostocaceae cyanobacterium]|nr:PEP-CTERM sorting domain-containing protein [Nostocaceae cyanobacterium]